MTNWVIEGFGWTGAIMLLTAYFLIQTKRVNHDHTVYIWLNIIGALFFVINTWYHGAYPSVFTNTIWALIGLYTLTQMGSFPDADDNVLFRE